MEDALSMQDPFLSAALETEEARKLNLTMVVWPGVQESERERKQWGKSHTNRRFSMGLGRDFKGFYPQK